MLDIILSFGNTLPTKINSLPSWMDLDNICTNSFTDFCIIIHVYINQQKILI